MKILVLKLISVVALLGAAYLLTFHFFVNDQPNHDDPLAAEEDLDPTENWGRGLRQFINPHPVSGESSSSSQAPTFEFTMGAEF